jgi:hypothetical protein
MQPESGAPESQLLARASRLRVDAGAAEVLRMFDQAGVQAVLLKGPSIAGWLYAEGEPRTYLDCDLLIAPAAGRAAAQVLQSLGYRRSFDDRGMPGWWREHAGVWVRDGDGLTVDLHSALPGIGVAAEAAWSTLAADTDSVTVAGYRAPTLALPARALHLALHAAQHGVGWARPIADLERALAAGDDQLWITAAVLAEQLEATDAFATGLRLCAAGASLATRLALSTERSVDAELRAVSAPPLALGFERLARAGGNRARLCIVLRKLVPPADFVRHWDPRAAEGRLALLRAYLRRPLWLLRRAPRGLEAWWRARRSVRAGSGR